MTGPEHYLEAERLITEGVYDEDGEEELFERDIALAQVHATLALAAATAMGSASSAGMLAVDFEAWDRVCGVQSPCTRCQGDSRSTVGLVCQACGRDYSGGTDGCASLRTAKRGARRG
jgi:hypothetical protein